MNDLGVWFKILVSRTVNGF